MSPEYGELQPTSGWDLLASFRHPCKFLRVSRLGIVTAWHSSSGCQPNFAALNRGRHLYLEGRPSRWALAHILVVFVLCYSTFFWLMNANAYFCCIRLSFFHTKPRDWLGERLQNDLFLCWVGHKTLTQWIIIVTVKEMIVGNQVSDWLLALQLFSFHKNFTIYIRCVRDWLD